ncbi:MAG: protein translocase subunit SecF [Propionibacteriaceae bacterium]|jgi:preprotein translocase subunit SecF|nr:protein translocase subunit SecF [Propionibacteriaceae bacterium]
MSATETSAAPKAAPKKANLAHRLWTGEVSYDFVGHRRRWYAFSAVILALSLAGLLIRGLDLGIEFAGGSRFQVDVPAITDTVVEDYRDAALEAGITGLDPVVTTVGQKIAVQTRSLDAQEQSQLRTALAALAGVDEEAVAYTQIGASWGAQVTSQAAIALVVFLVLVAILIWAYFRNGKMAVSALVCLGHDLIVTVGVYAWVGFSVTPATLTGVLTILGYSLYDTVVVFDKVRENWASLETSHLTYSEAANRADNQVLMRSINTTLIGVLPVAALLFAGSFALGSGPLEDIGLALFVGMIAGAYSSIFIATPLLAQLKDREPAVKELNEKITRRRAKQTRYGAAQTAVSESADGDLLIAIEAVEAEPASASPASAAETPSHRQQPRHLTRAQRTKR